MRLSIEKLPISELSPDAFLGRFFVPERPVIVTGVTHGWRANGWSRDALRAQIEASGAELVHAQWYEKTIDFLGSDFHVPELVDRVWKDEERVSRRAACCRIWVQDRGFTTGWHYDGNYLFGFNVHVQGRKRWTLVSPATPLSCHPFSIIGVPFSIQRPHPGVDYIDVVVEAGEMLFLPPLWFHRVETLDHSINLNWVGTKRHTLAPSEQNRREVELLKLAAALNRPGMPSLLSTRLTDVAGLGASYFEQYGGGGWQLIRDLTRHVSLRAALLRVFKELRWILLPAPVEGPDGVNAEKQNLPDLPRTCA